MPPIKKDLYPGNVSLARTYLEDSVTDGQLSNYSLCLVTYALVLANSPVAASALSELSRRADYRGRNSKAPVFAIYLRNINNYIRMGPLFDKCV